MKTREEYWALKAFKRNDSEEQMINSSEIFREYRKIEARREEEMAKMAIEQDILDRENAAKAFEEFQNKIANNSELRAKFRQIKKALDENPELAAKTDPNFINGIYMLDLED